MQRQRTGHAAGAEPAPQGPRARRRTWRGAPPPIRTGCGAPGRRRVSAGRVGRGGLTVIGRPGPRRSDEEPPAVPEGDVARVRHGGREGLSPGSRPRPARSPPAGSRGVVLCAPGRSVSRLRPSRPAWSRRPSSTSRWIQVCGFTHSTRTTVPSRRIGALASNSAVNAWCASTGTTAGAAAHHPSATAPQQQSLQRRVPDHRAPPDSSSASTGVLRRWPYISSSTNSMHLNLPRRALGSICL